jgi:HAD superfamily hydrolase (TIGR01509 family)
MPEALVGRNIRCLLFDLGDTLWYREDSERWERLEGEANLCALDLLRQHSNPALLPQLDDQVLGQRLRRAFDEQIRETIRCSPLLEPDTAQAIFNVLQEWGLDSLDRSLCTSLFDALRVSLPRSRPLFTDTLTTLAELRQRGFLLGVVTNRLWGGQAFHEDLQTLGLLNYFQQEHIAISGELGIRKPNPQIFQYALDALHVAPHETAMVGDSLSADILGAQSLGIYAIWKPKPWLYAWASKHTDSQLAQASIEGQAISSQAFPGEDTADTQITEMVEGSHSLPKGMHITDDDYILAHANMGRDYLEGFRRGEIRPDLIIGQVSELLPIFSQAAKP